MFVYYVEMNGEKHSKNLLNKEYYNLKKENILSEIAKYNLNPSNSIDSGSDSDPEADELDIKDRMLNVIGAKLAK